MRHREAGEILAREAKRFADRGWMLGTAGNLSVLSGTSPLRFFITASGRDKGELTSDDVAFAGDHGEPVADPERPNAPKPSAEAGLHARIYHLTGAGAIFHVHTVSAVVMGERHFDEGAVEVEGLEMLKGIGRGPEGDRVRIPIIANHQDMAVLSERFAKNFHANTPGVIVGSHGLYAWGKDVLQARHHVEIFEWVFQYLVQARAK
ncbi:MAG TPA: methylthioribulose 1-phosphate dehydratase [bacterium]|nr:methylthioribulose 1-phosphate dehydratase [bacterium]